MTRSDVALAHDQLRGVRAARQVSWGPGTRDCPVCGTPMAAPREQTLVIRRTARVVRHLHLCESCHAWESVPVAIAG